jgi:carbamoyltransferase
LKGDFGAGTLGSAHFLDLFNWFADLVLLHPKFAASLYFGLQISGGALGAAVYIYHCLLNNDRSWIMQDAYLGPDYPASRMRRAFINNGLNFKEFDDGSLYKYIAQNLAQNKTIGWFQGRMEFGPRALGNRSILANPANPQMKEILNQKVKHRESFRPYAPAVLEERVTEFFNAKQFSPFMLLSAQVNADKKTVIPAVTHVDGSARVQVVNKNTNPRLWGLIKEFENLTGLPVVLNTSFNLNREPIVCAPEEAVSCFQKSQMDCLVMGNYVAEK